MPDENDNNSAEERSERAHRLRADADKGREPQLVPAQMGRRQISLNALAERIEAAFIEEYGNDSPELAEADTPAKRLKLLLGTTDYVLSVESAQLPQDDKADLLRLVFSNLFGYGPLDVLFGDDRITTISLDGADKASVRYGHGELVSVGPLFHNNEHLTRIIKRLLVDSGTDLHDDLPYIETGLTIGPRPVSISLVAPPVAFQLSADIRVHPSEPPGWDQLIISAFLTQKAAEFLKALATSSHGLLIVGETESGKTTLLSVIASTLPNPDSTISVERAGELRLPAGTQRLTVQWVAGDQPGVSFGEQITRALEQQPSTLLLDEVRSDEPFTIAPLLQMPDAPRQIWSFRSAVFAKRLQSALGMLARRAEPGSGETLVRSLYERLPFVVAVNRVGGQLRLWSIGEWQFKHSPDYPTYTLLMQVENGDLKLTGERPMRSIELPEAYWE